MFYQNNLDAMRNIANLVITLILLIYWHIQNPSKNSKQKKAIKEIRQTL